MEKSTWTHLDEQGRVRMVDVTEKKKTFREAHAEGRILMSSSLLEAIVGGTVPKGNVLETARLAGIMGAKRTWEIIPLCHNIALTGINISFSHQWDPPSIHIKSVVKTRDRTGVEMEAITAVTVAALTIYDMCKGLDKTMTIEQIRLVYKIGGKSGLFKRE